jgi:ribulose-bisphosphate carboxylase large chain
MPDPHLRVVYHLTAPDEAVARELAAAIALEQTVELPASCVPEGAPARMVGRPGEPRPLGDGRFEAPIDYDPDAVGGESTQLLNLLFGNVSLLDGIRIAAVEWPRLLLDALPGPRLGTSGLRELCGVTERRPLLCAALKPLGLSSAELAERCRDLARGGMDIVKDDHGLSDQTSAPFVERVARCQEAIEQANAETGRSARYFPNLGGEPRAIERRLRHIASCGIGGVMVSPLLVGPGALAWLAGEHGLAILAHPALAGSYLRPDHGIAAEVLLGELFRLLGSDGVIYPDAGGRFPLTPDTCAAINDRLRRPWGTLRPSMPVPGGGIDTRNVPDLTERHGHEVMFLVGGGLYAQGDLVEAARRLRRSVEPHPPA